MSFMQCDVIQFLALDSEFPARHPLFLGLVLILEVPHVLREYAKLRCCGVVMVVLGRPMLGGLEERVEPSAHLDRRLLLAGRSVRG
jgi:hypothetical protein